MSAQHPDESTSDVQPRDQVEHYKIELTRLRSQNERLTGEVDYLRQALAAALSHLPVLDASVPADNPGDPGGTSASSAESASSSTPAGGSSWEQLAGLRSYRGYFPLASFIAPPVILLILLLLTLACTVTLFGFYLLFAL